MISLLLLVGTVAIPSASAQAGSGAEAARVRAKVERLGVGSNVEVKLRDETKLKGRIDQTEQHSFSVADREGTIRTIGYNEVAEVKKSGGVSTRRG